jgi:hypothetical protein
MAETGYLAGKFLNDKTFLVPKLRHARVRGSVSCSREISFRAIQIDFIPSGSAMKLPQQVRSQVELGNKGTSHRQDEDFSDRPEEDIDRERRSR